MVREGQSWLLPDDGELVEVAQFNDDSKRMVTDGWQLDFGEGVRGATLQAEPDSTVWVWLSRLLRYRSLEQELTVTPIEVFGGAGLIVADNVVWEDDGFVYRLTADETRGDTSTGRPVDSEINRLELVDRSAWDAAIERAQRGCVWGRVLRLRQSLRWPRGS